jgi:hypothetical protein
MPNFTIHYFIVKPTPVPVFDATTGDATSFNEADDAAAQASRAVVIRLYEQYLTAHFQACLPSGWTARVNRLMPQSAAPQYPDFSGVTIHWREPIVYWVSRDSNTFPANSTDPNRRPSLIMLSELEAGHYTEFSAADISAARTFIRTVSGRNLGGKALGVGWAPLVAEVFSTVVVPYDDVSSDDQGTLGWQRHQARFLANASFHEIGHGKCEWTNRPSSWTPAPISDSIHNHSASGLFNASVGYNTLQNDDDRSLMRDHVRCPMPYYKLGVPVANQCYQQDHAMTPTPPAPAAPAAAPAPSPGGGGHPPDPLDDLDI